MYTRIDDKPVIENFTYRDGSLKMFDIPPPSTGQNSVSLSLMLGAFIFLSIILAIVFFFLGPKDSKFLSTLAGFGLGVVISIFIWVFWGKNNYKV
jgi:hypothetical protein